MPLVIYAILAEQNIAKLFAAAMVPGIIAMVGYMIAIAIYVRVVPGQAPTGDEVRAKLTLKLIGGIAPIAIIFLIVFGGIYGGKFTPTEGAAVGAAATFVAALLKREITWPKFKHCFYATAEASAMIFLIFIGADLMNSALALTQVPAQLASVVKVVGPVAADGRRRDHAVLRRPRRGDGRAVDDPADDPDLLSDDHGARLRHAEGIGRDLVRHHGADDGRLRPAGAAGRA